MKPSGAQAGLASCGPRIRDSASGAVSSAVGRLTAQSDIRSVRMPRPGALSVRVTAWLIVVSSWSVRSSRLLART